jgi:ABC-2 type transport system ATP-binding protein
MAIVEAENLTRYFPKPGAPSERIVAVDHVSFAIEEGEIFGILGPNGAGKTTTLEMIEGLVGIDDGNVTVAGISVKTHPLRVKQLIGIQLQESEYFDYLDLSELLTLFGILYGRRVGADELLHSVGLDDKKRAYTKHLSGGQKQRFSIASALVNDPRVLFLDEPTTGLDPRARRDLWDLVRDIHTRGKTVVLTTHYMEEAEALCGRVAIMDRGRIIALGTPQELIERHAPERPPRPVGGTLEDVFLTLTGRGLE